MKFSPQVAPLETRLVLSAATLTVGQYNAALREIRAAVAVAGKTGDLARANADLDGAVDGLPGGPALAQDLQIDAAPGTSGKARGAYSGLVKALNVALHDQVKDGTLVIPNRRLAATIGRLGAQASPSFTITAVTSKFSNSVVVNFTQTVNGSTVPLMSVAVGGGNPTGPVIIAPRSNGPVYISVAGYPTVVATTQPFRYLQVSPYGNQGVRFYTSN